MGIRLPFEPARHGFHFANGFTNNLGSVFGYPVTTRGLCGGMTVAAFNYYTHGYAIPTHVAADFASSDGVPPEGSRLRDYIFETQMTTYASAGGYLRIAPPWVSDDDNLRNQYRESLIEFDRIRRSIDRGLFVLVALASTARGDVLGHQTLAYGYDVSPPRVYVYDPNFPGKEMVLGVDAATERIIHTHADGTPSTENASYSSYFLQVEMQAGSRDVITMLSEPTYRDLGLREGLSVTAPVGDGRRQVGERLELDACVCNFGDYPSSIQNLVIWARDPAGNNRDADFGQATGPITLAPGEDVRLHVTHDRFGDQTGTYRFGVSILSADGCWIDVPGLAPGSQTQCAVDLVAGNDTQTGSGSGGFHGAGTYFIRARHSGKVLDVDSQWASGQNNGRPVCQYDNHGGDNQKFVATLLADGYVTLQAVHSGKSLDIQGASTADGAILEQWDGTNGQNQQFAIEPIGDHYRIRARHSGLCLDVAGASRENGAQLTQWTWWGGDNQLFQFEPAA